MTAVGSYYTLQSGAENQHVHKVYTSNKKTIT